MLVISHTLYHRYGFSMISIISVDSDSRENSMDTNGMDISSDCYSSSSNMSSSCVLKVLQSLSFFVSIYIYMLKANVCLP